MDISVRGYLNRQPTEVLQSILQFHLQDGVWQDFFYTVPIILDVLEQRNVDISQEIYARIAEIEALQQKTGV